MIMVTASWSKVMITITTMTVLAQPAARGVGSNGPRSEAVVSDADFYSQPGQGFLHIKYEGSIVLEIARFG